MTSRERVIAAIEHRKPDRVPLNYFGTDDTDRKLMEHLGLSTRDELLCHLGTDMRYVRAEYSGPSAFTGIHGYHSGGGTDMWGMKWKEVRNEFTAYNELIESPLAGAQTPADVERHAWPSADWLSVGHLKGAIAEANRDEPRAIVYAVAEFFEISCELRGTEQFLMDMVMQPDIARAILGRVIEICRTVLLRGVEEAEGEIDIVWTGSDVGMQTGMMFAPELWREIVKPLHRTLIEPFGKMGVKTRYHSDGGVAPIIPDLIEMGLDLLDPIQPNTPGMDPQNLKALSAGRLAYYGGVDTQHLMPYGTAAEVEAKVLELIETLGAEGGYVAAASNAVQPDVPVENALALYRTAREYRY